MSRLIISTLRILFRNKAFWFFLLIAPLMSILILNLDSSYTIADTPSERHEIVEISKDEKISYYGGAASFSVKVYDSCGSGMTDLLLQDLADTGMYTVCRADVPGLTKEELDEHINFDSMNDRMGAALYIDGDFDKLVLKGDAENALKIFILSEDPRAELFEEDIKMTIGELMLAGNAGGINDVRETLPKKNTVRIVSAGERELSHDQEDVKMKTGYAFSILTFGFVFCGVFVAHTAIEEQKNMVLTRIRLSGGRDITYLMSKTVCTILISVMITMILTAGMLLTAPEIAEIGLTGFILTVFLLGIVFSVLSMFLGIISGEVMSSNFVAFTIWCMSSLFAGLYFPLDDSSVLIRTISYITPQRWFMEGVEMFIVKDSKVFMYLICITAAYLMVILSIGNIGIKLKKQEA